MGKKVNRRQVLAGISLLMGGTLSPSAVKAIEATVLTVSTDRFQSFTTKQVPVLQAVIDTILPETDTASATGAGVDRYIDHMIASVLSEAEGNTIKSFLDEFLKSHPQFLSLSAEEQHQALSAVDAKLWEDTPFAANYRSLKELTLIGYYTSEIGASIELEYDPVPGPFHNGPVSEYGRTWATI